MENQFKIGDKVRLSSGESPMMTINEILYDGGIVFLNIDVPEKTFVLNVFGLTRITNSNPLNFRFLSSNYGKMKIKHQANHVNIY